MTTDKSRAAALTEHLYILSVNEEAMEEAIERFDGSSTGEALTCVLHAQKQLRALLVTPVEQHEAVPAGTCACGYSMETSCNVLDPMCCRNTSQPAQSAPLEGTGNGADAWMTDDGRVISDEQKQQALRDGGACASSVRPYSIDLYRRAPRTEVAGTVFDAWDAALTAAPPSADAAAAGQEAVAFQSRVQPWMLACFGAEIAADRIERNHRFLEEALELVQACGCTASEAHQLVDYTFGRPVGEPAQEAGGVMVTLAALCLANSLDMHAAGETELARVWTKVEQIRAKQAAKPKHSPLPEAAPPAQVATRQRLTDGQRGVLTYANQPDNVGAWRLGEACHVARAGGDPIDRGLSLLKELQDRGYGVIALLDGDKHE